MHYEMSDATERIRVEYVRLDEAVLWERNPKQHDIGGLVQSIEQHGFRDAPVYDGTLGAIVAGNGRLLALMHMMRSDGAEPPRGIALHKDDGMWCLPIQFGIDAESVAQAEAFAIEANNLVLTGGDLESWDILAIYNEQQLAEITAHIQAEERELITLDNESLALMEQGRGSRRKRSPERWAFQVHFEASVELKEELEALIGPYFMPRSRRKLMPEFFTAMVRSYCGDGQPVIIPESHLQEIVTDAVVD
jgi:hypothetical protein